MIYLTLWERQSAGYHFQLLLLQERAIRKKLQQIEALEQKAQSEHLDAQQQAKITSKATLLSALQAIEVGQAIQTGVLYAITKRPLLVSPLGIDYELSQLTCLSAFAGQ